LPVDADSKFILESVSKTFLSAAIAVAVEDGKIQFDDPVAKLLPDFDPAGNVNIRAGATISRCLSHTSGLANPHILLCGPENLPLPSEAQFMDFANSFPTRTCDGQQRFTHRFNYTNAGYALPALALQRFTTVDTQLLSKNGFFNHWA
jgi:CubicO group peptidase (beta-lactamase class C family)